MAWLALLPGRLLERTGNSTPRGMVAHDRTRLNDRLPTLFSILLVVPTCFRLRQGKARGCQSVSGKELAAMGQLIGGGIAAAGGISSLHWANGIHAAKP